MSQVDISGFAVALASKSDHGKSKFCQFADKSVEFAPVVGGDELSALGVPLVSVEFMSIVLLSDVILPDVLLSPEEVFVDEPDPELDPDEDDVAVQ